MNNVIAQDDILDVFDNGNSFLVKRKDCYEDLNRQKDVRINNISHLIRSILVVKNRIMISVHKK